MHYSSIKIAIFATPFILGPLAAAHAGEMPSSQNSGLTCELNPTTIGENGYQLEIYLTNTGGKTVQGWSVTMSFDEPSQLTGSWNANLTEVSMTAVTAGNVAWNGRLLPGQTTSFGLQGNHDGSFVLPACSARKSLPASSRKERRKD